MPSPTADAPAPIFIYTAKCKYYKGDLYDTSRPEFVTEILNGEGTPVIAQFAVGSCVLKLFKLTARNTVQVVDEKNPFDVLDLGLAQLCYKGEKATDNEQGSVVTVTHVAGHGVETLVFVFKDTKQANDWCYVVNEAQSNLGLDAPRAEGGEVSAKLQYYCSDLANIAKEFGVNAKEVLLEKIAAVQQKREDLSELIKLSEQNLEKKTVQIQCRDYQIKLKEKDVSRIKAEQEALRPSHQYKYIVPFKPDVPNRQIKREAGDFNMCSEEDCIKLAEQRASARRTSWKVYDQREESEVLVNDIMKLAKQDLAKHGGVRRASKV